MNHCVPDFHMDEDYSIPPSSSSSSLNRSRRAVMGDEDIMELLWQDGQVVMQSQNQWPFKKSLAGSSGSATEGAIPTQQQSAARDIRSMKNETMPHHQQQLFMHEDEMASWLHYPIDDSSFDRDIYSDLLYPPLSAPTSTTTTVQTRTTTTEIRQLPLPQPSVPVPPAHRPPIPPPSNGADLVTPPTFQNIVHFSRLPKTRIESEQSSASKTVRESTVVESNDTPGLGPVSRVSGAIYSTAQVSGRNVGCGTMSVTAAAAGTSTAGRELTTTCELTVTSSPGGSGGSVSASVESTPIPKPTGSAANNRKRKGREPDDADCHSEDIEFETAEGKKQARGSTPTKRSRAAEVHNLSERRRRDRINEKMRALQELIPRCNKSDKASMLDEAIEYLKSLQLQVQMMSMGCGILPMMYPGVQHYMPAMGMGMGMGLGMDVGMNRPMMPYPPLMPGSGMPIPAAAGNMGPRFPVSAFHMQPIPMPDPSRIHADSQPDSMLGSLVVNNPNQPQVPNFSDTYQQFMGLQQAQMSVPQNQVVSQPIRNKPSSSRDVGNPENQHSLSLQNQVVSSQPMSNKPSSSRDVGNPKNQQTG